MLGRGRRHQWPRALGRTLRARLRRPACLHVFARPRGADPTPEERKWLEQVLFGPGPQRDERVCQRWTRTPKVALVRASPEQKKAAEEAVKHLNDALAGTPIFKLDLPGKEPRPGA